MGGEKGTLERQRALLNFFGWPLLRAQSYPGRTDFIKVTVENGQVAQIALLLTSEEQKEAASILNLPWELYEVCPAYEDKNVGRSAGIYSNSMHVTEPMDFTITVEQVSGVFEFGVKEGNKLFWGSYIYESREFGSESDTFHLEPGYYDIVMHMEAFQGSYHLVGKESKITARSVPSEEAVPSSSGGAVNLPVEGTPEVSVEPLPPVPGATAVPVE